MSEFDHEAPKYPMLKLVVRYGNIASAGLAVVVFGIFVAIAVAINSIAIGLIGIAAAALAYVLIRILVELVSLITDMLLPQ
jgi:hypothetical protein